MPLHLIKLCVGADTVDELSAWRAEQKRLGRPVLVNTRQSPKRCDELLDGGSLFWVIKGVVRCRQGILAVDTLKDGARTRCEIHLDDRLVLTEPLPRRAFQGWRYLDSSEAPGDLDASIGADMPADMAAELRALGAW